MVPPASVGGAEFTEEVSASCSYTTRMTLYRFPRDQAEHTSCDQSPAFTFSGCMHKSFLEAPLLSLEMKASFFAVFPLNSLPQPDLWF